MLLTGLIRIIRMWAKYHQGVRALSRLDDRELADIGIARSDIDEIAWRDANR